MYIIQYRRPEMPWCLERMTVQSNSAAASQVQRLIALGYRVVDVTPPLEVPAISARSDPH